jgi:hypothetical protein
MSDPADKYCLWKREPKSSREWYFPDDHPGEDSELLRTLERVWSFCPYCGRPISMTPVNPGGNDGR